MVVCICYSAQEMDGSWSSRRTWLLLLLLFCKKETVREECVMEWGNKLFCTFIDHYRSWECFCLCCCWSMPFFSCSFPVRHLFFHHTSQLMVNQRQIHFINQRTPQNAKKETDRGGKEVIMQKLERHLLDGSINDTPRKSSTKRRLVFAPSSGRREISYAHHTRPLPSAKKGDSYASGISFKPANCHAGILCGDWSYLWDGNVSSSRPLQLSVFHLLGFNCQTPWWQHHRIAC